MEKSKATTDTSFNSNPNNGKTARPPIAPKATVSVVVHAGHPGVNTANALPATVELPDFFRLVPVVPFILYTSNEIFIPASIATAIDRESEVARYNGIDSVTTPK